MKKIILAVLALILLSWNNNILSQDFLSEKVKVKVKNEKTSLLSNSKIKTNTNGIVQTGIANLDAVLSKYNATALTPLFPSNPKFEKRHHDFGLDRWYVIDIRNKENIQTLNVKAELDNTGIFEVTEYYYNKQIHALPQTKDSQKTTFNDPRLSEQWHYNNTGQTGGTAGADISLTEAWSIETGSNDVVVAIIDGGIDYNHQDLSNAMWLNSAELNGSTGIDDDGNGYVDDIYGYNFADNTGSIAPHHHGTHVAGTVGAVNNNNIGVAGIAGGSDSNGGTRLMSCQVFSDYNADGFDVAFVYAADNGAVIAQNSWGYTTAGNYEQSVLDAIDYFIANAGYDADGNPIGNMQGGLVVFSAGNDDSDDQWYPGYYEPVFSVASTNHNDQKSWYSNYGDWVDISAPGGETNYVSQEGVLSTLPNNSYGFYQGTSMACPHVSGVAALIVSHGTNLTPEGVEQVLLLGTDYIDDINSTYAGKLGQGRLNAFKSLSVNADTVLYPINDLSVNYTSFDNTIIQWTGQNNFSSGKYVASYDIRFSTNVINDSNFDQANQATYINSPLDSSEVELFEISNLDPSTDYYFAVKALGVLGHPSDISNIISVTTKNPPVINVSVSEISDTLFTGESADHSFEISNTGESDLIYSFAIENIDKKNSIKIDKARKEYVIKVSDSEESKPIQQNTVRTYNLEPLDGLKIYFLTSSYYYEFINDLETRGANVISNYSFQSTILDTCDIFIVDDAITNIPDISYINNWIKNGGGYLSIGDNSGSATYINQAIDGTGITFTYTSFTDRTITNLKEHALTDSVETITLMASGGYFDVNSSDQEIAIDDDNNICIAATQLNDGKVVVVNNEIAGEYVNDNITFLHNTIDWLSNLNNSEWLEYTDITDTIAQGEHEVITITLNASGKDAGIYNSNLIIKNNDPDTSNYVIPVTLEVIGSPEIKSESDSVILSTVFTNQLISDSILVENIGTDTLKIDSIKWDQTVFTCTIQDSTFAPGDNGHLVFSFISPNDGLFNDSIAVFSNSVADSILYVELFAEAILPPVMSTSPDSIIDTLYTGQQVERLINIDNSTGGSNLYIDISKSELIQKKQLSSKSIDKFTSSLVQDNNPIKLSNANGNDTTVLIIQDTDAWGVNMYNLLYNNFNITSTTISSYQISSTDFSQFDLIITVGDEDNTYYDAISANQSKFEDYVTNGGTVQYQLATQGSNVSIVGNVNVINGNNETYNTVVKADHPIVDGLPNQLEGSSANHCYFTNLTNNALIITETSNTNVPTTIEYSYGKGSVIATGMTWEFLYDRSYDAGLMLTNALSYTLSLTNRFSWLITNTNSDTIPAGSSVDLPITLDATGLNGGDYSCNLKINSNDPLNQEVDIPVKLNVIAASDIFIEKDTITFDTTFVTTNQSKTVIIQNNGVLPLSISLTSNSSVYKLSDNAFNIDEGEEDTLTVTFEPDIESNFPAKITLNTNDPDNPADSIMLFGVGLTPPELSITPDNLYTTLDSGDSTELVFNIANIGANKLTYSITKEYIKDAKSKNTTIGFYADESRHSDFKIDLRTIETNHQKPDTKNIVDSVAFGEYCTGLEIANDKLLALDYGAGQIRIYNFNTLEFESSVNIHMKPYGIVYDGQYYWVGSETGNFYAYSLDGAQHGSFSAPTNVYNSIEFNGTHFIVSALFDSDKSIYEIDYSGNIINVFTSSINYNLTGLSKTIENIDKYYGIIYNESNPIAAKLDLSNPTIQISDSITLPIGYYYNSENYLNKFYTSPFNGSKLYIYSINSSSGNGDWLNYSPVSGTILSGNDNDITVDINASGMYDGIHYGNLLIESNDPANNKSSVPVTLTVIGYPELELSMETLEFDSLFVGTSQSKSIVLTNTGTKVVNIDPVNLTSNVFEITSTVPTSIEPGQSELFTVRFLPDKTGSFNQNITFESDATINSTLTLDLIGKGVEPPVIELETDTLLVQTLVGNDCSANFDINNSGLNTLDYNVTYSATNGTYVWESSLNSNQVKFNWFDITNIGEDLNLSDDSYATKTLPFDFDFYGSTKNTVYISSNGFLSFNSSYVTSFSYQLLPNSNNPNDLVAAYWDDLFPDGDDIFYFESDSMAIVQYNDMAGNTFQIILYPDNTIKYQYLEVSNYYCSVGIENSDGTEGLSISYNQPNLNNNMAIKIYKDFDINNINPSSGSISKLSYETINMSFETSELYPGTYEKELLINSNDPVNPAIHLPIKLMVIGDPVFTNMPDTVYIQEGETVDLNINAIDLTDLDITYSLGTTLNNASLENDVLTFSPDYTQSGVKQIVINASNGFTSSSYLLFFNVENVNRSPVLTAAIEDQDYTANNLYYIDLSNHFTDPDGDDLTFSTISSDYTTASSVIDNDTLIISARAFGITDITVIASDNDLEEETTFKVNVSAETAVDDVDISLFEVYPNPAKEFIYINTQNLNSDKCKLKIIDQDGRLLLEQKLTNNNPVNVKNLPKGIAIIQLETDYNVYTKRVVLIK